MKRSRASLAQGTWDIFQERGALDRRSFLLAAAGTAAAAGLPRLSSAAQIDNVRFEDKLKAREITLKLQGAGLLYYKLLIKAVAAGLYLDERVGPAQVLSDVAKRLEMQYFWGVSAQDLVKGSEAMLQRNLGSETIAALRPQIDQMHALYRDVKAGDRCSFTYMPGIGTWLTLNGKILGTVAGADFAAAYFSIWFGNKPMDAGLKRKLLGGS
jgi:hypothetical protein